jgi:hypothetical protein
VPLPILSQLKEDNQTNFLQVVAGDFENLTLPQEHGLPCILCVCNIAHITEIAEKKGQC